MLYVVYSPIPTRCADNWWAKAKAHPTETIGGLQPTLQRLFEGLVENPDMAQFFFDDVVDSVSAGVGRDEVF